MANFQAFLHPYGASNKTVALSQSIMKKQLKNLKTDF
jgi:hypothetical protein